MPNIPLQVQVGIDDFSWFDEHDFTLEIAQTIINNVKRRADWSKGG